MLRCQARKLVMLALVSSVMITGIVVMVMWELV